MGLIERLETAERGSFEFSREVADAAGIPDDTVAWHEKYSESIDAAVALVREKLPKWRVSALLETARRGPVISPGTWEAALRLREEFEGSDKGYTAATAKTAPLALVIALLRALECQP